jgi:PIN domain nuclease of toxin-antitoxin system
MKKYLLDTHVVLWLMFDVDKIPEYTLKEITDSENKIYISAASFWEISIKFGNGKLDLNKFNPTFLPKIYEEQGFEIIPVSINETATFWELKNRNHKDPFDRMLIWQAIKNDFTFISNDKNMSDFRSEGLKLLW